MSHTQGDDSHRVTSDGATHVTSGGSGGVTSRATTPIPTTGSPSQDNSSNRINSTNNNNNNNPTYTSWTVPSLDNLFSSKRASAFGTRYGFMQSNNNNNTTIASGRSSPAPSGMSIMLDGGPNGANLLTKARRMSIHTSETLHAILNDSSLVLYRVNEHIHKKVPVLVQEKKALSNIRKNVETANQDLEDARLTISSLDRIAELGRIEELVHRSLSLVGQTCP